VSPSLAPSAQPGQDNAATAGESELPITVVGIGEDGWDGLSQAGQQAIRSASVVVGSTRQLELVPEFGIPRKALPSPLLSQLDGLVEGHPGLCFLASGDPMLHGIGATLSRLFGADRLRVYPQVSSVALACARLGWDAKAVDVISLVAGPPELLLPALQPGSRLILLCRDGSTPQQAAHLLRQRGWGASHVRVLERLGGPAERVSAATTADELPAEGWADLSLLAVEAVPGPDAQILSRLPGLPSSVFESDGQISRRELRVLALAGLAPAPGQLLWDIGAGSGSIGIEWMRTAPSCRTIAIEPRPDRAGRIGRNALALGVPGLEVVVGSAPEALAQLPSPDAIFIGGGVTTEGLVQACWDRLITGGRLVAHAVTTESEAVLLAAGQQFGGELTRIAASTLAPLGGFTTWRPQLPVVQWQVGRQAADSRKEQNS
jgi:precorrin-6Y C5,15-methyltransferase (decarboxylating)